MYALAQKHLQKPLTPTKAQSSDAEALWAQKNRPFGKSETLEKSIGPIKLSGLKDITTRPDQQVMSVGTKRQADIARKTVEQQQRRGDDRDVDFVGQAVKKPIDDLATNTKIYNHKKRMMDELDNTGKFKAPSLRERKDRDQRIGVIGGNTAAGINIELGDSKEGSRAFVSGQHFGQPIGQHEAHHHLFDEVDKKYGDKAGSKLVSHLYDHVHPEDKKAIEYTLTRKGYSPHSHNFKEEALNYLHDIITHKPSREDFFTTNPTIGNKKLGRMKSAWKNIHQTSKGITPDFFKKHELEKNMHGIRAGILSAVVGMSSPAGADQPKSTIPDQVITHDQRSTENNKDHILNAISTVESSGGKNTEHERLPADSIHQGERAYGSYGLTPLLMRETIGQHKDLARKYNKLQNLKGTDFHEQMKEHPELEKVIASRHYDRLAKKFGHDPAKIGFAWLNGITGTMKAVKNNTDINNHWHVMKIMDAYKKSKSGQ
jgi:hypothetical protein